MHSKPYALAHIDGEWDCDSLITGVMEAPENLPGITTPLSFYRALAGGQFYPVWAMDRLAACVFCYRSAAMKFEQHRIEINVTANLYTDGRALYAFATKVIWHTSSRIRSEAELQYTSMVGNGRGNGRDNSWADRWPFHDAIRIPVADQLL